MGIGKTRLALSNIIGQSFLPFYSRSRFPAGDGVAQSGGSAADAAAADPALAQGSSAGMRFNMFTQRSFSEYYTFGDLKLTFIYNAVPSGPTVSNDQMIPKLHFKRWKDQFEPAVLMQS